MSAPLSSLEEIDFLLSKLNQETADKIMIIGGQALNLWGHHYLYTHLSATEKQHLASYDLDLLARRPEIERCARAWNGDAKFPSFDDSTIQSGIVLFKNEQGKTTSVDFLSDVYGVERKHLEKHFDMIQLSKVNVPILSPPLVLKSRLANLSGLGYGPEKMEREITRVRLACLITNRYIEDTLDNKETRKALNIANYIFNELFDRTAVAAAAKHNINLLMAVPHHHPNWPSAFREKEWPRQTNHFTEKVENYRNSKLKAPNSVIVNEESSIVSRRIGFCSLLSPPPDIALNLNRSMSDTILENLSRIKSLHETNGDNISNCSPMIDALGDLRMSLQKVAIQMQENRLTQAESLSANNSITSLKQYFNTNRFDGFNNSDVNSTVDEIHCLVKSINTISPTEPATKNEQKTTNNPRFS